MVGIVRSLWWILTLRLKSRKRLEAENVALRHQLNVVCRSAPKRVRLRGFDRLLFIWLYRLWPGVLDSIAIIQPETVVRWHRLGFKAFCRPSGGPRSAQVTTKAPHPPANSKRGGYVACQRPYGREPSHNCVETALKLRCLMRRLAGGRAVKHGAASASGWASPLGRSSRPAHSVQHEPTAKIAWRTPFGALILVEGKPNGDCPFRLGDGLS